MSKPDLKVLGIKGGGYANLTVVDVEFEPGVNKIGGKNRQGKSNLIELIKIFKGKEYMADVPLNIDADDGKFTIPLVDGDGEIKYTVKYSFTKKKEYVSVTDEEGNSVPLQMLKDLLSPCVDPNEFHDNATATGAGGKDRRMKAINILRELMTYDDFDQAAVLKEVGLTRDTHIMSLMSQHKDDPIAFLDSLDSYVMENRAKYKVKKEQLDGTLKTLKEAVPTDKRKIEPLDIQDIFKKQEELQEKVRESAVSIEKGQSLEGVVTKLEAELEDAKKRLETWRSTHSEDISEQHAAKELEELKETLASREEHNKLAEKAQQLRDGKSKMKEYEKGIEIRDAMLKSIRKKRVKVIEDADMPVEGLSIEGDTILKNGIPLGQDSTEEGLTDSFRIGVAHFKKLHPDQPVLKTMLISNASLMDKDSREKMYELAKQEDIQMLIELVMEEKQKGVIFVEDGVAVNTEEEE